MAPGLSQLEVVPFKVAAYNTKLGAMDFYDPEHHDDYEFISGTKMRRLARSGEEPPNGFMAPTAWKVRRSCYSTADHNALGIFEDTCNVTDNVYVILRSYFPPIFPGVV